MSRALAGSRPGRRSDGARIALAIEGGGMAGSVTGGMCAALEESGLIGSFDVIYGSSAGALNAAGLAAGQAQQRIDLYVLATRRRLINPLRVLAGRPAFRADAIFDSLLNEYPLDFDAIESGPELKVTATRLEDGALTVLEDFASYAELLTALRASCSIPGITGDVVEFRGREYVDAALSESLPYRAALAEGATHVVVLRSRAVGFRQPPLRGARRLLASRLLCDAPERVVELYRELPARYNAEASELESPGLAGRVAQVAPPSHAPLARQLESRAHRVVDAVALGARTVHERLAVAPRIATAA